MCYISLCKKCPYSVQMQENEGRMRKMCPCLELFWSACGKILRISPYSVQMRKKAGKMWTRITPNTDAFYAVYAPHLTLVY